MFPPPTALSINPQAVLDTSSSPETTKKPTIFSPNFSTQNPARPGLHFYYGYLLFPRDPEMAGNQFREELDVNSTSETQALLALTLIYEGRFADALLPAQAAYEAEPNLHIAQIALGRALVEAGDMKRGTELLTQALQRDPNDLEAHLGLVSVYSRTGNREEEARERKICRDLAK